MGLAARKSVLEELGYELTTATNGREALDQFADNKFDLIVTDYKMPRMNGIELIERIRTSDDVIPVILLSGFAEAMGLTEANTGANIVIQKNAHEVVHLTRAVARLLRKKTPRKPGRLGDDGGESPAQSSLSGGYAMVEWNASPRARNAILAAGRDCAASLLRSSPETSSETSPETSPESGRSAEPGTPRPADSADLAEAYDIARAGGAAPHHPLLWQRAGFAIEGVARFPTPGAGYASRRTDPAEPHGKWHRAKRRAL